MFKASLSTAGPSPHQPAAGKESGNGPSLAALCRRKMITPKEKSERFLLTLLSPFSGHFCPATEAKGKKWKILGIFLTAKPADMMDNLREKIEDIESFQQHLVG